MATPRDLLALNFDQRHQPASSSSGPRKLTLRWAPLSSPSDPDPFSNPDPSPLPSPKQQAPAISRRQTQWPSFVPPKTPSSAQQSKQQQDAITKATAEEKSGKGWGEKLFYVFVTMPMSCWYTRGGKRVRTLDEEGNAGSEMEGRRDWDHRI
jgi:hypothetical protein